MKISSCRLYVHRVRQRILALALLAPAMLAHAQLPGFGLPPACPPNTSCVPGTPPIIPPTPPGTCGPAPGGNTCGAGGPASTGDASATNVGAGNPINIINGNKYQREVDMAPLPGILGLEIVRHYNSAYSKPGGAVNLLGRGWKLSYETELHVTGTSLQVLQADGARLIFNRDPRNPSLCAGANPADGSITQIRTARGSDYVWRWTNGRQLTFNGDGKLVQILVPGGQFVSMQHDARGVLLSVTDPQGRRLRLHYPDKRASGFRGVQRIDSPVGSFTYSYGSPAPKGAPVDKTLLLPTLVKVAMPSGARYYHYEDARFPTLLTGISELAARGASRARWERIATYGYDANGKGNLSVRGVPARLARRPDGSLVQPAVLEAGSGIDQVTLDHGAAGQTTVTNGQGRETVFKYAVLGGRERLLEVRGAGCAGCGDTNVRYRYDSLGRLTGTISLDAAGLPVASSDAVLDALGRTVRLSRTIYRDGRQVSSHWQQRFEYAGDASQPVLIARPSVIPGKEHVTRIRYGDKGGAAGLPVTVTEHGYAPAPDSDGIAPITRSMAYRYDQYGQQLDIDGPLPNGAKAGPQDSDITRMAYDERSKLLKRTVAPGNVVTEVLERDAALRPRVMRSSDGAWTRVTTLRSNWRGQPEEVRVETSAPDAGEPQVQVTRYRYDLDGRLLQVTDADGRTAAVKYDHAGRPLQPERGQGGAPLAQGMQAVAQQAPLSGTMVQIDWSHRPVAWSDGAGRTALRAVWGAPGTAAESFVLAFAAGSAEAIRLVDDFGRVRAIRNPGQGWQIARHDEAGNIVELRDPRGAIQRARWDHVGRLLEVTRTAPKGSRPEHTLTYRYQGMALQEQRIADADGTRVTLTERDGRGLVVRETLQIDPAGALARVLAPIRMRYLWKHDGQGRVVARSIVDQHGKQVELVQELDAHGMPVRIATRGALPAALGGGNVVAASITWKNQFATAIEHGEGSTDRFASAEPASTGAPSPGFQQVGGQPAAPAQLGPAAAPGSAHDAAGYPAAIDGVHGPQRLTWNAAGQLAQSTRAGGSSRYIYDAQGQRVVKLVSEGTAAPQATVSFYEGRRLAAEADRQGHATHAYAYLGWRALAQLDLQADSLWQRVRHWLFGAAVRALHTDRAGKVLSMSDGGRTVWQDEPAQTGLVKAAAGARPSVHQPLRYVGQYHDHDSGLAYHGARYFDPARGRFISPDPLGIGDALDQLPASLLLDMYAYAGGQPDEFFDPDGAARIRYFAITTGANGASLGNTTDKFTRARWAFIVDNIQAGGTATPLGNKRNEYAANRTGLLVDVGGNFLAADDHGAVTWNNGGSRENDFRTRYGANLISIPEFTVEMDDDKAATLVASYIQADRNAIWPQGGCPARNSLLPEIRFGDEEVPINVTRTTMTNPGNSNQVLAQKQRIVECGPGSANDVVQRRIQKYNYAAMLLETYPSSIYRDCSSDGCPGRSLNGTQLQGYVASYGTTQLVAGTLVENLRKLRSGNPLENVRTLLSLDDTALWTRVEAARLHGQYIYTQFPNWPAGRPNWNQATQAARQEFMQGTGMEAAAAEALWNDINRWRAHPSPNLGEEARQAVTTTVMFADPVVRNYLMGIYRDSSRNGRFDTMSLALIRKNYEAVVSHVNTSNNLAPTINGAVNPAWAARQRQIELELAARTAKRHNAGQVALTGTMAQVTGNDSRQYVRRFLHAFEYPVVQPANPTQQQPTGDYFALRCTDSLPNSVPRHGLEVRSLNVN